MNKCEYKYCGGCNYKLDNYELTIKDKQESFNKLFKGYKTNKIIKCENPYHYRNKSQISFGLDDKKRIIMGNYVESSHIIVPIKDCLIVDEKTNEIFNTIYKLVIKYKISVFNEYTFKGFIRHVLVRNNSKGEYMVVLVSGTTNFRNQQLFINDLLKYCPYIKTIVLNINNKRTSLVLGEKNIKLYGNGYIYEKLCGLKFRISPASFFQVNSKQTEVLYSKAIEYANFKGNEVCIDAYCGTGTIGMIFSSKVKKVYGVELNKHAVSDANKNKEYNEINNIEFICEDAGKYMKYLASKHYHIDTLIMDPPRSGADDKFINSINILSPNKIVYISCNPNTLKTNIKQLEKLNYKVETLQPVDMFPFTSHIETIALISRK